MGIREGGIVVAQLKIGGGLDEWDAEEAAAVKGKRAVKMVGMGVGRIDGENAF